MRTFTPDEDVMWDVMRSHELSNIHDITRTPPVTGGSRVHPGTAAITSGATLSSASRAA